MIPWCLRLVFSKPPNSWVLKNTRRRRKKRRVLPRVNCYIACSWSRRRWCTWASNVGNWHSKMSQEPISKMSNILWWLHMFHKKMDCVTSSNSTVLCTCHPKEIPTFTDLSNLNPLDPWKSLLKIVAKKLRRSSPSPRATGSGNAAHRRRLNMRQSSTHPKPKIVGIRVSPCCKTAAESSAADTMVPWSASGQWSLIFFFFHLSGASHNWDMSPYNKPLHKGFCKIGALFI